jgi:hypothetical protein
MIDNTITLISYLSGEGGLTENVVYRAKGVNRIKGLGEEFGEKLL